EYQRAETVALVETSLGQLSERYRTALVLKDLQGLEPTEIAEVMEVSRANADVLVHRARASFKTVFAKLAGSDAAAPAALGLVLLPLSVPAALQAMPPLPAHLAPLHAPVHPGIPATAGPAGAGLLTKIGAALTTKAAIGAAAAAVVIGGGVVAVKEVRRSGPPAASAAVSAPPAGSRPQFTSAISGGGHDARWAGHGDPMGAYGHEGAHHAGDHSGSGSHHSATHDADDSSSSAPMTTHDSATTTTHAVEHSTSTTTTHDGGDMSGGGDGSSHE
ncbi:MAG TPA: sigma-70 family RNA polymerase sigma factor, partial [Thermoleophilia bacterium]